MGLSKRMAEILPVGRPDIQITEDGGVYIGWVRPDGKKVAYAGLSGGEKALFDPALAYALKANVLLQESAELDSRSVYWSHWGSITGRRSRFSSQPAMPRRRSPTDGRWCGYE